MLMKKLKTLISAALCLCTMCAASASALEYNINAPGDPEYGKPTSFEPVVTADGGAMKNEDLSKFAALIPPGFGTPTSYMLNTGEYLTPNLVPSQMAGAGQVNGNVAVVMPPPPAAPPFLVPLPPLPPAAPEPAAILSPTPASPPVPLPPWGSPRSPAPSTTATAAWAP